MIRGKERGSLAAVKATNSNGARAGKQLKRQLGDTDQGAAGIYSIFAAALIVLHAKRIEFGSGQICLEKSVLLEDQRRAAPTWLSHGVSPTVDLFHRL